MMLTYNTFNYVKFAVITLKYNLHYIYVRYFEYICIENLI